MTGDDHWSNVAKQFGQTKPPLRPGPWDTELFSSLLRQQHEISPLKHALLLGVTPEIATLKWPDECYLVALERAVSMIDNHWPGDIENQRSVHCGDWFDIPGTLSNLDVIIGDGCFSLQEFESGYHQLCRSLCPPLSSQGALIIRCFVNSESDKRLVDLLSDIDCSQCFSMEEVKSLLFSALASRESPHVKVRDIWSLWKQLVYEKNISIELMAKVAESGSFDYYENSQLRLSIPYVDDVKKLLGEHFKNVEVFYSDYKLASFCPILLANHPLRTR